MNSKFKQLNQDDIDNGLSEEFAQAVKELQAHDQIDEHFQVALRNKIVAQASGMTLSTKQQKESWFMHVNKFILGFGVSLAVVALVWYASGGFNPLKSPGDAIQLLSSEYEVNDLPSNSFGSLAEVSSQNVGRGGGGAEEIASSTPTTATTQPASSFASSDAGAAVSRPVGIGGGGDSKLIAPYPYYRYEFEYVGGDLPELSSQQPVFRRVKDLGSSGSSFLKSLKIGLLNLNKFSNTSLDTISFSEQREFGYTVNLNFTEASASIYENWMRWNLPERQCQDEACYNRYRFTENDIPEDSKIIDVATKFVSNYNIPTNNYGTPFVNNDWKVKSDTYPSYFPDVLNVVYPLILEGKTVYEENGYPVGLNVSVNLRQMKVSSVYEITTQKYDQSSYAGVTDQKKIIGIAEKGGFRNYDYFPAEDSNIKTLKLKLQTPKFGMVRVWQYNTPSQNQQRELFVPALIFPIENNDIAFPARYWRQNIIVPLVQEVLDSQPGGVQIMPLMEKSVRP